LDVDDSAHGIDDLLAFGQTDSGAGLICGEERFPDIFQILGRDTLAGIFDFDQNAELALGAMMSGKFLDAEMQGATIWHGFSSVVDEIDQYFFKADRLDAGMD